MTRIGRLRAWIIRHVLRDNSETCNRCGRRNAASWWCDDPDQWERVYERATGRNRGGSGLLCARCFVRFAEDEHRFVHLQAHVIDRRDPRWPAFRWRQR